VKLQQRHADACRPVEQIGLPIPRRMHPGKVEELLRSGGGAKLQQRPCDASRADVQSRRIPIDRQFPPQRRLDPVAIGGAILVHALSGDRDPARAVADADRVGRENERVRWIETIAALRCRGRPDEAAD
jgi:hypothetical protein